MPVVINEFEVVPSSQTGTAAAPAPSYGEGEEKATTTARDIASIIRRERERYARVWAH